MKRIICSFAIVVIAVSLLAPKCAAEATSSVIKKQENHTVSLELEFYKKKRNTLQRVVSFLDYGPNGYATGFIVGDGLVMTAYHVVSGELSAYKKELLGFAPTDKLEVKVSVNGCRADVIKVDTEADLALLSVCQSQKKTETLAFQTSLSKDERLLLIARPHGNKLVRRGTFYGPYMWRGMEYWSAKIDVRDGYSGSPVYNDRAELIGVFSSYDMSKKLAVISPGIRAQKLLEDYLSELKP